MRIQQKLSSRVADYTGEGEQRRKRVYTQVAQQTQEGRVEFPSQYLGELFKCALSPLNKED